MLFEGHFKIRSDLKLWIDLSILFEGHLINKEHLNNVDVTIDVIWRTFNK